ncbi:hypothetical protein [Acidisphaera sp. S103]|uniref:hypothetical protein n=1 Tax=Acidisphaera sp. S103 TaxID=1747223 RepID=UPI00131C2571|nr:hypothetical protein [Acidisphaera sp. S103]
MEWTLRLVGTEMDGQSRRFDVIETSRPDGLSDIPNLGLTLAEAKQLLVQVQQEVVAAQARHHAIFRPDCQSCGGRCHMKDWRRHRVAALFGEVRVGNIETETGGRQVFGAVTRSETDITALIQRTLETAGRTDATKVTAFPGGCPGLRTTLTSAGVTQPPISDGFHIAMRLQHTKLAARNLSTDGPDRVTAKANVCTGAFGTAKRRMPSAASTGSARSCMSSKGGTARARRAWHRASCGTQSINISEAKPRGWSTMPNASVQPARRNFGHRGHSELPGQSAREQIPADAMVTKWRRSAAPSSLRGLQWHARSRVWASV